MQGGGLHLHPHWLSCGVPGLPQGSVLWAPVEVVPVPPPRACTPAVPTPTPPGCSPHLINSFLRGADAFVGMLKDAFLSHTKLLDSMRQNFTPKCIIGQIKHCPVLPTYFIFGFMYFILTYLIIQL